MNYPKTGLKFAKVRQTAGYDLIFDLPSTIINRAVFRQNFSKLHDYA